MTQTQETEDNETAAAETIHGSDKNLTCDELTALQMYSSSRREKPLKPQEPSDETEELKDGEVGQEEEGGDGSRRSITYQIEKNKGLTPKRSKAQRNPRVKHRNKFEKAKVRRKGQVREVRKELAKYGGEISGINARVKKGVKLA